MSLFGFLGGLVGAGASMFGANKASNAQNRVNKRTIKYQMKANRQNLAAQKLFAKRAVRWRVNDAKRAGLHPLAALGMQATPFSPSFQAPDISAQGHIEGARMMADAGQNLGRAIGSYADDSGKLDEYTKAVQGLSLENMALQNSLLATKIRVENQAGSAPSLGGLTQIPGQAGAKVVDKPLEKIVSGAVPGVEPAAVNDVGYLEGPAGAVPVISKDASERLEDDIVGKALWYVRNQVLPNFDDFHDYRRPPRLQKPGFVWRYSPVRGYYEVPASDYYTKPSGSGHRQGSW